MAKFSLILLAVPLATAGIAAPAFAQDDTRSVSVSYDDLNLSSERGRERLTTRVRMAVQKVCGSPGRVTLRERVAERECKAHATRDAETKLAALFNGGGTRLADQGPVVVAAP
jgi:UrcA family protein